LPGKREQPASPLSESKVPSRPQTANRPKTRDGRPQSSRKPQEAYTAGPPMPGALPPTPGTSEGESSEPEYVIVDRQRIRTSADLKPVGKDGDMPPVPPPKDGAYVGSDD
jgi:hypothetical protein